MADVPLKKASNLTIDPPVIVDCPNNTFKQNYVLLSFVSPVDRVKQRFLFEANRFLYNDINKQLIDTTMNLSRNINTEFAQMLDKKIETYMSSKDPNYQQVADILNGLKKDLVLNEDEQTAKTLRIYRIDQQEILDRFETYKSQNGKELEAEFNKEYTDQASVYGVKVRGVYEDPAQAD